MSVTPAVRPVVRRLIVGLGNIGPEFHRTRHNVGFAVCKLFASEYVPKMDTSGVPATWKMSKGTKCCLLENSIAFSQESEMGLDLVDRVSDRAMEKTRVQGVPFPTIQLAMSVVLYTKNKHFKLKNPGSKNLMDEFLVVHDDISIPFGQIRFSPKVDSELAGDV